MKVLRTNLSAYNAQSFTQKEKISIESIGDVKYFCAPEICSDPEVLITNTHTNPLARPEINWNSVKLIIHPNSGYDNFDAAWVKECKIPIVLGNQIRANAVINYTLSALFHAIAPISFISEWDKNRQWDRELLSTKNILLIGYGLIGKSVAAALTPLVNSLTIYDPYKNLSELPNRSIDIVIVCASLNVTSKHLINLKFLNSVLKDPDNFVLINGARGEILDEDEVLTMVKNRPSKLFLDVFETEPFAKEKFLNFSNVYKTSHIAGVFNAIDEEIINFSKNIINEYMAEPSQVFLNHQSELLMSKYHNGILI